MAKFESEFDIGDHVWVVVYDPELRVHPATVDAVEFSGESRSVEYTVELEYADAFFRISTQDTDERVFKTEDEAKAHRDYLRACGAR